MINFLDFCTEPSVLKVILFAKTILKYAFIIIPIGLLVMLGIDIFKNIIAKDVNNINLNINIAIKRLIYIVILFFVPTIVNIVVNIVNYSLENTNINYKSCTDNINNIEYYENLASEKKEKEKEEVLAKLEKAKIDQKEQETIKISYSSLTDSTNSLEKGNNIAENYVDYNDITKISGLTKTELIKGLKSEKNQFNQQYQTFIPYVDAYIEAERKYSVNLFWLLPHETIESGWGVSRVAKACNNLGGLKYASNQGSTKCYDVGQTSERDGYYAKFNSPKDFILYHAKLLNTSYLNPKGTYYEGPAAVDILIHYWGNPDLSSRNKYVGYVKTRAQAIIKGLS